mmetsp:Transcript_42428/g.65215  ORF Transcript_42428/g.65215 Transcript_42428/m.65215 type:complete len:299 (+) Transcript_42428:64-960(+)
MSSISLFPAFLQRVSPTAFVRLLVLWIACRSRLPATLALSTTTAPHVPVANNEQQSQRATTFPNSLPVRSSDVETLIRQTGQVNPSLAAIGIPSTCSCQHGFPQAFSMDPLHAGRINSGTLKLTCPHLVRAVDALEDQGMILAVNQRIFAESEYFAQDGESPLRSSMIDAHERHARARRKMLSQEELDIIRSKLGDKGMQSFLEAGVAGASIGSHDSKCLHAWLADALFYGSTPLGAIIQQELEKQNVDLSGTPSCRANCDPACSTSMANPPKPRNKQRLKTRKEIERRKRRKVERQE